MQQRGWLSDEDYDYVFSRSPRVCVDLVVRSRKGIILTKRSIEPGKGLWHLPGGRVRFREKLYAAAKRIAMQELGIRIRVKKMIGYVEYTDEIQGRKKRHSVSLVFLSVPVFNKVKTDWQSVDHGFFKAAPKNMVPAQMNLLKKKRLFK